MIIIIIVMNAYYINHSMVKKLLDVVNIHPYAGTKNFNDVVRFIYTEKNWLLYHQAPPPRLKIINCYAIWTSMGVSTAI